MLLLRIRAETHEYGTAHGDAEGDHPRRTGERGLLVVDVLLGDGPAGTAIFLRPVRRDPALGVQRAMPVHDLGPRQFVALLHLLGGGGGQLRLQEGASSAERRVGKEGVSTCRFRWSPE